MKIYFAWVSKDEAFDPTIHCREDEKIFHLEIRQREGGKAIASALVANPGHGLLWSADKRYCLISFDEELMFRGRVIGMPAQIQDQLISLNLIAVTMNTQHLIQQSIEEQGEWDDLFETNSSPSLQKILQGQSRLLHWCRKTGKLSLSGIFEGTQHSEISGDFFEDSLGITIAQDPLTAVNVELVAEWTQQARGSCELGQHIKKACPRGRFSTLTGISFEQSWWRPNDRIRHTGYKVLHSQLAKLNVRQEDQTSESLWHFDEKPIKVKYPQNWYDLQLNVGWQYKQKRRERLVFKLRQTTQDIAGTLDNEKTLCFHLASIVGKNCYWRPRHYFTKGFKVSHQGSVYQCQISHQSGTEFDERKWQLLQNHVHVEGQAVRATFFRTDRGRQAVEYALEVAKSHLAASARCIGLKFTGDLKKLKDLTLDHHVTLEDKRLPGRRVTGKVTSYRFIVDGTTGEKIAHINLGVAVGTGKSSTTQRAENSVYAQAFIFQENPQITEGLRGVSNSSIHYQFSPKSRPTAGILNIAGLNHRDILESVKIIYAAPEQYRELQSKQYPFSLDTRLVLQAMPTDIQIKLKDLKTVPCLEHQIELDILTTWSAPKQIDLSAETNQ